MRELHDLGFIPLIVLIHLAFWWKFYRNPWLLCTSETASNFFPYWRWFGKNLRKGTFKLTDNVYYGSGASIPFLSTFYPPNLLSSFIGAFLSDSGAFRLYVYQQLLHSLLTCLGAYWMLSFYTSPVICMFGALSLTYNAYMIRPQTPCFMFTAAWIPIFLVKGWVGMVAFGMAVLGGYWPILLTGLPIVLYNPSCLWGIAYASPQVIPFLRYFPTSIRAKKRADSHWGRMPLKRFFFALRWPENGMIHYPEYSFGVGICLPLALYHFFFQHFGGWALFAIYGFIGSQGWFVLDRIPARFVYLVSFSLVMGGIFALHSLQTNDLMLPLMILQGFLLWKNRDIYPSFPFSQWWRKITEHEFVGTEWPNNTGYMNGVGHQTYYGGFSLAENYHE